MESSSHKTDSDPGTMETEKEGRPAKRVKTDRITSGWNLHGRELRKYGWCTLKVGSEVEDVLGSYTEVAQGFFTWSSTAKLEWRQGQEGIVDHYGYLCVGGGAKEVLDVRKQLPDTAPPMTLPLATQCHKALDGLARTVLGELSEELELPAIEASNGSTSYLEDDLLDRRNLAEGEWSSSILTVFRYAPSANGASAAASGSSSVLAPPHIDRGVLTIICSETEGLKVRRDGGEGSGPWVNPSNIGSSSSSSTSGGSGWQVTVILGATLEHATAGAVRATEHRVVGSRPRHSIVYRLRARPTAVLNPPAMIQHPLRLDLPGLVKSQGRRVLTAEKFMQEFATNRVSINRHHGPSDAGGGEGAAPHQESVDEMVLRFQEMRQSPYGVAIAAGREVHGTSATSNTIFPHLIDYERRTRFKVKRHERLESVFKAYASHHGVGVEGLRFFLWPQRLTDERTPAQAGLEDDDLIDVFMEQNGD